MKRFIIIFSLITCIFASQVTSFARAPYHALEHVYGTVKNGDQCSDAGGAFHPCTAQETASRYDELHAAGTTVAARRDAANTSVYDIWVDHTQHTSVPGAERLALTPDGKHYVFVKEGDAEGQYRLGFGTSASAESQLAPDILPHLPAALTTADENLAAIASATTVMVFRKSDTLTTKPIVVPEDMIDMQFLSAKRLLLLAASGHLYYIDVDVGTVDETKLAGGVATPRALRLAPNGMIYVLGDHQVEAWSVQDLLSSWSSNPKGLLTHTFDHADEPDPLTPSGWAFIGTQEDDHVAATARTDGARVNAFWKDQDSTPWTELVGSLPTGAADGFSAIAALGTTGSFVAAGQSGGIYVYTSCIDATDAQKYAPAPGSSPGVIAISHCTADLPDADHVVVAGGLVAAKDCPFDTVRVDANNRVCALDCGRAANTARVSCSADRVEIGTAADADTGAHTSGVYRISSPGIRFSYATLDLPQPKNIKSHGDFADRIGANELQPMLHKYPSDLTAGSRRICFALNTTDADKDQCPDDTGLCTLTKVNADNLMKAVKSSSVFSMRAYSGLEVNNIPVGTAGAAADGVYTSYDLLVGINDGRVVTFEVRPRGAAYPLSALAKKEDVATVQWSYCVEAHKSHVKYHDRHAISAAAPSWPWAFFTVTTVATAIIAPVGYYLALRPAQIRAIVTKSMAGPAGPGGASRFRRALYRRPAHPELLATVLGFGTHVGWSVMVFLLVMWMAESASRSSSLVTHFARGFTAWIAPFTWTAATLSWVGGYTAGVVYKLCPDRYAAHDESAAATAGARSGSILSRASPAPWVRIGLGLYLGLPLAALTVFGLGYMVSNVGELTLPYGDLWVLAVAYLAISAALVPFGLWAGRAGARVIARAAVADARNILAPVDETTESSDILGDDFDDDLTRDAGALGLSAGNTARASADRDVRVNAASSPVVETLQTVPQARFEPSPRSVALGLAWVSRAWRWLGAFGNGLQRTVATVAFPTAIALGHNPTAETDRARDEVVGKEQAEAEVGHVGWLALGMLCAAVAMGFPIFAIVAAFKAAIWGGPAMPPMEMLLFAGVCYAVLAFAGVGPALTSHVLVWRGERWAWPSLFVGAMSAGLLFVATLAAPGLPTGTGSALFGFVSLLCSACCGLAVTVPTYAGSLLVVRRVHAELASIAKNE